MADSFSPTRKHMPALDGLRGLAALMVLSGHAPEFGCASFLAPSVSHYGVLIFFALSGFLMGTLYLAQPFNGHTVSRYISARIARIVPIYYIIVLCGFFIYKTIDHDFIYNITDVQLVRLLTFNGSASVFWSIGPEFQFYFVFIFVWFLFNRFENKIICFSFLFIVSCFGIMTMRHIPGVIFTSKFHIFSTGILFSFLRFGKLKNLNNLSVNIVSCMGFLLLLVILFNYHYGDLFGRTTFNRALDPSYSVFYGNILRVLVTGFIVMCLSYESRFGDFVFGNRAMVFLGAISFSVYLLHIPVYYWLGKSGALHAVGPYSGTFLAAVVTVMMSALSYRLLEMPLQKWSRTKISACLNVVGARIAVQRS